MEDKTGWFKYGDDKTLLLNKNDIVLIYNKWPEIKNGYPNFDEFYKRIYTEAKNGNCITNDGNVIVNICEKTEFLKERKFKRNECKMEND